MTAHEYVKIAESLNFDNGNTTDGILVAIDFSTSIDTICCLRAMGNLSINSTDPNAQMMLSLNIDKNSVPDSAYLIGNGPFAVQNAINIKAGTHKAYLIGFNEAPFNLTGVSLTAHLGDVVL